MVSAVGWAALGTGFIFLMTLLGTAAVFFFSDEIHPNSQNVILGFAGGVMIAAAVWSLLLPAIERSADLPVPCWFPPAVGILLGVALLAGLDAMILRLAPQQVCSDPACRQNLLLFTAITLHNIPEGMAVGLAFALAGTGDGIAAACVLALGIGVQNFPEGAAISLPLFQAGLSKGRSFLAGTLSGAVEPVFGMLAFFAVAGVSALMPWMLSFAAGAMLYVVVEELVPQAHGKSGTLGFILGFLVMMILDVALG